MNYLSTHSPFTPAEKAAKQSLFKDFGCLFFRFISGNNSIYFSNSQIIRSILFLIRSVMFCMEISCLFDDHSVQCKKCDQVRECHQCIEDICDIPYCRNRHIWSDEYTYNIKPSIRSYSFHILIKQIFQASFSVIIPSKNRCKCKKYQTNHQCKGCHNRRERKSPYDSVKPCDKSVNTSKNSHNSFLHPFA